MVERRHYQRFVVEGIEGTLMFATDVDIINISINGVALRANRRLEIGREYTLKLEFHDKVISLNGIVAWSVLSELARGQHEEKVPIYKAGMRFTNVISEKMARLLDFIDENKLAPDHRLTIRFGVRSPDRASLNGPHNYKVKKVSDNGMLIETDLPFEVEESLPMEIALSDDTTIRFVGRVASCLEITNEVPKHYDIGVQFIEISGNDKARFNEFIKSLCPTQS
ncbi:MAG: PilZ domain-containing protein [Nitrospirota bacterium]